MRSSFQKSNNFNLINRLLQIALGVLLIWGMNYLGANYYKRWDTSSDKLYSLSPETRAYLQNLEAPVKIIVTRKPENANKHQKFINQHLKKLLAVYEQDSKDSRFSIEIEYVDVYRNLERSAQLARAYNINQPDLIVVSCKDRYRVLNQSELLVYDDLKPVEIIGEQALTSAILDVSSENSTVVYFTVGHGEMQLKSVDVERGLSQLSVELEARNIIIKKLDLTIAEAIPADAKLIVCADPSSSFSRREENLLKDYLANHSGRMISFISPGFTHGLDELFYDWGIQLADMVVIEGSENFRTDTNDYVIRHFAEHVVTQPLIRNELPIVAALSRPVRRASNAPVNESLNVIELIATSEQSWGERRWRSMEKPVYDPGQDIQGPVPVAVLAERIASSELGISISGGRLAVFGFGNLVGNSRLSSQGNFNLFLSLVNHMLERDELLSISPKPIEKIRFNLSAADMRQMRVIFLLVPAVVVLLGFVVAWFRRG